MRPFPPRERTLSRREQARDPDRSRPDARRESTRFFRRLAADGPHDGRSINSVTPPIFATQIKFYSDRLSLLLR